MNILLKEVRISGFRGLENFEIKLEKVTVLTGMNNSGKTSFLKALQVVLGNRQFISQDDFSINENETSEKIIIDILIVPCNDYFVEEADFSEDWEILFTTDRIRIDGVKSFIPIRTIITFDTIKNSFKSEQYVLPLWPIFKHNQKFWYECESGNEKSFHFEELPFFFMDAQRDILEDTKLRGSYISKMLSKIEYSQSDIKDIEEQIKNLNEKTVASSDVLRGLTETLKELDSAMDSRNDGIDITPFTKKLRDLSKGLTIYYTDKQDSFSMEYHGMGTRSWSSLLTLKSFILLLSRNAEEDNSCFFPVLAIEEPEAHLHPNAQKKLYKQLCSIKGQIIISTHSPYIAASANLSQVRNIYKNPSASCGQIPLDKLSDEDIRKIKRQVINTRGEIFFSKVIIFFEGETEEQALPIFSEKYFNLSPVEMGLDFIGVGGYKSYLPFLRFAENLNIPWLIFSDADVDVQTCIDKHLKNLETSKDKEDVVVFLDDGNDFEKQLIQDDYREEIRKSIASFDEYSNAEHRDAKEENRKIEISNLSDTELLKMISSTKTKFGPAIAEQIIMSGKELPPKVIKLFEKTKLLYGI